LISKSGAAGSAPLWLFLGYGLEMEVHIVYNSIGIVSLEKRDPKMLKKVVR